MSLYTLSVYVVQTVAVLVVLIAMCACYLLMLHVADGEREPHPEELVLRQAIRDAKTDPDGLERSIRAARKAGVDAHDQVTHWDQKISKQNMGRCAVNSNPAIHVEMAELSSAQPPAQPHPEQPPALEQPEQLPAA